MKIVILDGERRPGETPFAEYLAELESLLGARGHQVERLILRDLEMAQCLGCWGCWVKTPGECVLEDDGEHVCRSVVNSDLVLLAAPLVMGFPTALLKRTVERLIPLIHPYNAIVAGEIHHRARYKRYPTFALLTERGEGDTDADLEIVRDVFSRTALNFKSKLAFLHETSTPIEEVARVIES
jgi:multimeric flavodoxin WrbA